MAKVTLNVITRPQPFGSDPSPGNWEVLPMVQSLPDYFENILIRVPPRHPYRTVPNSVVRDGSFYSRTISLLNEQNEIESSYQINFFQFGLAGRAVPEELAVIALELLPYGFYDLEGIYSQSYNQNEIFKIDPRHAYGCIEEDEDIYFLIHGIADHTTVLNPTIDAIRNHSARLNEGDSSKVASCEFSNHLSDPLYQALKMYLFELRGHSEEWLSPLYGRRETRDRGDGELVQFESVLLPKVRQSCTSL